MEGSPISMRLRLNLPLLHEIGGFKWHKWHLMNHLLWYSDSQPHSSHFPAIPLVFKLAWNYANDPNKGLSLPSLSLLCCICQRQSIEQMKSNSLWQWRYMTTISEEYLPNDLFYHKDLWELAVGGDIHDVVSVLQISVPWMPNRKGVEKSEEMPVCWLHWENHKFWEKGSYSLVSSLLQMWLKHLSLVYLSYRLQKNKSEWLRL